MPFLRRSCTSIPELGAVRSTLPFSQRKIALAPGAARSTHDTAAGQHDVRALLAESALEAGAPLKDPVLRERLLEIGIAASLIALALSVLSQRTGAGAARELRGAALLTLGVGLLHGLGFADGLQQLALPTQALWPARLGFNLGVEAAQLGLVLAVAPLLALLSKVTPARQQGLRGAAGHLIGSLAAMWLIERTLELFS